jgi:hypothetical protein
MMTNYDVYNASYSANTPNCVARDSKKQESLPVDDELMP